MSEQIKQKLKHKLNLANNTIFCATISASCAAAMLSAAGIIAHIIGYIPYQNKTNYSLKNRFECAYSFNTPKDHKIYYSADNNGNKTEHQYIASPFATYPIIIIYGVLGGMIGAAKKEDTDTEYRLPTNQKTR